MDYGAKLRSQQLRKQRGEPCSHSQCKNLRGLRAYKPCHLAAFYSSPQIDGCSLSVQDTEAWL